MSRNYRLTFCVSLLASVITAGWVVISSRAAEGSQGQARSALPLDQRRKSEGPEGRQNNGAATQAGGLAAWEQVYSVLISPRCINCHTATNYPQQGDDRHRHVANVIRGPEGKGVPGLNCASCHQETNADSTGVPGGHNWHLAPLSMKWQDLNDRPLSSAAVCRAVTDRSRNHNLDGPGLLKHHEEEALVLWAWNPGRRPDGSMRTLPPFSHEQFVAATRRWVDAGTPCPTGR